MLQELCPICHRAFQHVKRHIRDVHLKEKRYSCRQCNATFSQKGTRDRHEIRIHTQQRAYICPHCQKGFKVKWDLTVHMRGVCSSQPPPAGATFAVNLGDNLNEVAECAGSPDAEQQ